MSKNPIKMVSETLGDGVKAVGQGVKKVGDTLGGGAKIMGETLEGGAKKVGNTIGDTLEEGALAIGKGAKKVGRGATKTGEKISDLGYGTAHGLKRVQMFLEDESIDTTDMFITYNKFVIGKASKEEMEQANQQFGEVLKTLGLGTMAVLPGSVVTLPAAVIAAKKMGIDIVPKRWSNPSKPVKNSPPTTNKK
jgi:hypothetical protein